MVRDDIINKYRKKARELAQELADELLKHELDLEKRFTSLDAEVQTILQETGNKTMEIIGENLERKVKKKPPKKG